MDKWIGQRLECLCKQQGMTQEALAAVVQRSQSWMSTVLKDKRDPGFHEVEDMLRALGTSLEEVVKHPGKLHSIAISFNPQQPPDTVRGQAAPESGAP
ncbi:MAG: helix-turn-helix domain-containing protein [Flavobacteriales bacterium]|nr:helix-turn-helix domain-containing protein [Flavobacteriales bacterium]